MPDIYMHSKMALEVSKEFTSEIDYDVLTLASQGPDPLYFNVFSKQNRQICYEYADHFHETDTKDLMIKLTRYTKQNLNKETYSYLFGFICHYALDTMVHPYIYYNTGIYDQNIKETKQYRGLHLKFERSIDACLIKVDHNIPPHKLDLTEKYFTLTEPSEEIKKMMGYIINDRFKIENGSDLFTESAKSMYKIIEKNITDKTGIKKQLYKLIDVFTKAKEINLQDLSFYHRNLEFDFLNNEKRIWHHPVTNEPHNESILELYDQAKNFAIDLITKVNMYLQGNKRIELSNVFTNLSFNSGIDCNKSKPFQYFNNYTKKIDK